MNEVQPIRDKRHINAMKRSLHGRNLLLFTLGINTGLRISDLLKMRVADVKGRDFFEVREQKTGKTKRIHFNRVVKQAIADTVPADAEPSDYLFASRKGSRPITRVQAYRILNDAAARAGIADKVGAIGTHTLRKTFGYQAYKQGGDIALLMRVFNHSSQDVTLRYIGVTDDVISDVYATIEL